MSSFITFFLVAAITHANGIQAPVNLGTAGNYVIVAQTGLTTTGNTAIIGNIALGITSAAMTGFSETLNPGGTSSTSALVTGTIYAANYAPPTPTLLTQVIADAVAAYNDAATRTSPDYLDTPINGPTTLQAGLYKWTGAYTVQGAITLTGNAASVFIFQVGGALDFASTSNIILSGGVLPSNVIWQGNGAVSLLGGAQVQGIVLGLSSFALTSGARLVNGRAFAQSTFTMIGNTITQP